MAENVKICTFSIEMTTSNRPYKEAIFHRNAMLQS